MTLRTTTDWLTVNLYYGKPWEEFLVKAVKPYTEVVTQTGVAERFFFERNWERGPNISLTFKGSPNVFFKILKPNLEEHFLQYFDSRPSSVNPPKYPSGYPSNYKWHPTNSIHYANSMATHAEEKLLLMRL